jgi:heme exporter protein A
MHLTAENLAAERGGRLVFEGVSFTLSPGGALMLTGPNGAGKTTLLRLLAGFLRPAGGALDWRQDKHPFTEDACLSDHLHFISHDDALKPALSVRETLRFWAGLFDARDAPVDDALKAMGLAPLAQTPCGYLSAGQRRRVALSRLSLLPRPLWLLDEPFTALDGAARARLLDLMAAHRERGGVIIAAVHDRLPMEAVQELRLGGAA